MFTGRNEYNPLYTRGADLITDQRLCLEAHDDYFNCLDDQKTDSKIIFHN